MELRGSRRRVAVGSLVAMLVVGGCSSSSEGDNSADASTTVVADPTTSTAPTDTTVGVESDSGEWVIADPAEHGFDPVALQEALDYASTDGFNTQGLVVVRGGEIVAEYYDDTASADSWAASWSMAKSMTSALIGIAIEDGLIPGVDEPMTTWYPQWAGQGFDDLTLKHLLQMTDGFAWDENYDPNAGMSDIIRLVTTHDPALDFVLGLGRAAAPGEVFNYSSGTTLMLSGVLEQATGMAVSEYAQQELFGPMRFTKADWWNDTTGTTLTYCCVDTTTRDFARFGQLYLNGGSWGGEQLVPQQWVTDSVTAAGVGDAAEWGTGGYGYQWWLTIGRDGTPSDYFAAVGHDGQYIIVVPEFDLVIARNSTYVKHPGKPIADPNLFLVYPSDGIIEGQGTVPSGTFDDAELVDRVVASITK